MDIAHSQPRIAKNSNSFVAPSIPMSGALARKRSTGRKVIEVPLLASELYKYKTVSNGKPESENTSENHPAVSPGG